MTAVAFRNARVADDDEFKDWVSSLVSGEPVERGAAIDPAAMQVEMPDIPIAGSGEGADAAPPPEADQRPGEIDGDAEEDELDERNPAL
jgi:hypothetical protein